MIAGPGVTLNRLPETISEPVVIVTVRPPVNAIGLIVMFASAVVASTMVRLLSVMPWPNVAVVLPVTKFVNCEMICSVVVTPCMADTGATPFRVGTPGVIVKPFCRVATSPSVRVVMVWNPVGAFTVAAMSRFACVASITFTLDTLTPEPKSAVVTPSCQWVFWPVSFRLTVEPCGVDVCL